MLPAPQYSQDSGWGLPPLPCQWYFGHIQPSGIWEEEAMQRSSEACWLIAALTDVWQCAVLWQQPAAVLPLAKTIGSRWLCPILPWNSFKLKKIEYYTWSWFIVRKWNFLYFDFISCEFHKYWWESRLLHSLLSTAQRHGHAKVRKVQLYSSVISKADFLYLP